ncbi:MAG: PAS-domain containing protein [Natronospirillum sp.]
MRSLRQRAPLTMLVLAVLTLSLGIVGWWALAQTERTASDAQARTLVDVSTAMSLAERAAQIAALGPYVGESAVPFQLQTERAELEERFLLLQQQVAALSDPTIRQELNVQVDRLHTQLRSLTELVEQELFLLEDLRVLQFELSDWQQQFLQPATTPAQQTLAWLLQPLNLEAANAAQAAAVLQALQAMEAENAAQPGLTLAAQQDVRQLVQAAQGLLHQRARVAAQKNVLFASIRAQSEALTFAVQDYVTQVQTALSAQREQLSEAVQRGRLGILLVALLALAALIESAVFMVRMTRDLQTVTDDMTHLAEGRHDVSQPMIQRHDEIGELARTYQVFRDDSLRMVEISRDLDVQKRLLETVLDTMNDGLSVFSADQKLLAWNTRYVELFDLSAHDVARGMTLQAVQTLMAKEDFRNLSFDHQTIDMQQVNDLRSEQAQTFERHYHSGKVIEFRSQPMPNGGFVTLYSDLTERRAVEHQLQQAQKMEALGQLIGGVAHDFNNLLAALVGNLQLLQGSTRLPEQEKHYAERALGVAERGAHLVERLLAFSRKQQLNPELTDVSGLIEGMADLLEYSVSPQVAVNFELSTDSTQVWVDPSQLENALLNLVINASAAMPDGGTLTLCTRTLTTKGSSGQVEIEVRDTGMGMTSEVMARVWEPFFTTKPVGQGSGLGLSLVYGFVKQSGGDVLLESQLGKGTRIRLYLPMVTHSAETELHASGQSKWQIPVQTGQVIVVVEDDLSVQRAVSDMLRSLDFSVQVFTRAEDAMLWLDEPPPVPVAAVLSDINLAGELSGVELAEHLARALPDLPVVLTSGLPREHLRQHYGLHAATPLLSKPVRLAQLQQVFQHVRA